MTATLCYVYIYKHISKAVIRSWCPARYVVWADEHLSPQSEKKKERVRRVQETRDTLELYVRLCMYLFSITRKHQHTFYLTLLPFVFYFFFYLFSVWMSFALQLSAWCGGGTSCTCGDFKRSITVRNYITCYLSLHRLISLGEYFN